MKSGAHTLLLPSASMRFVKNAAVLSAVCRWSGHMPVSTYSG